MAIDRSGLKLAAIRAGALALAEKASELRSHAEAARAAFRGEEEAEHKAAARLAQSQSELLYEIAAGLDEN